MTPNMANKKKKNNQKLSKFLTKTAATMRSGSKNCWFSYILYWFSSHADPFREDSRVFVIFRRGGQREYRGGQREYRVCYSLNEISPSNIWSNSCSKTLEPLNAQYVWGIKKT